MEPTYEIELTKEEIQALRRLIGNMCLNDIPLDDVLPVKYAFDKLREFTD